MPVDLDYAGRAARRGRIRVDHGPHGMAVTFVPDGESFVVGTIGLACLLALLAGTLAATFLTLTAGPRSPAAGGGAGFLLAPAALLLAASGIGFLVISLTEIFRSTTLRCEPGLLHCARPRLLGTRRRTWEPARVRGFRSGRYQLSLALRDGGEETLLDGIRESERPALAEVLAALQAWLGRPAPAEPLGTGGRRGREPVRSEFDS